MKKVKGVFCYIYIALWILYYLQELLKIVGVIAQSILVILIVMSIYAFIKVNMLFRVGPYLKWLNIMLFVITIYGLIQFFNGFALYPDEFNIKTGLQFSYIQRIYSSVLPIFAFYYFTRKGDISEKNMNAIFFVLFSFSILMYYENFLLVSKKTGQDEITNNMGYRFVPLIPMLTLVKMKDIWRCLILVLIIGFIITAMKRGAILVGAISLLLYIFHHLKVRSTKRFIYIFVLSIVMLGFISLYLMNLYETSEYFNTRLQKTLEGDTSSREWIYSHYLEYFLYKTTNFQFLFGCGADATFFKLGEFAHNDWLEFAVDQGAIGVVFYMVYWIVFVKEWREYQGSLKYKQVLGDTIILYFIVSWFSMSFDGMPVAATLCIGCCLAQNEKAKRAQLINEIRNRVLI